MNETSQQFLEPPDDPKPSGFIRLLKLFFRLITTLLVLALLTVGGWYAYQYFYSQEISKSPVEDMGTRLEESERTVEELISRIDELVVELQRQEQTTTDKIARIDAFLDAQELRFDASIKRLRDSISIDPRLAVLGELEAIVKLANQQLSLNLGTARVIETLTTAEQLLARLDDPDFYEVRALLNKDLNLLRQAPIVDIHGAFLEIESLKSLVAQLPLSLAAYRGSGEGNGDDESQTEPDSLWSRALSQLGSLVEVREHGDNQVRRLLSDAEASVVQLRLLVSLDTAQFALVTNRSALYHSNLDRFMVLVGDLFNRRSDSVQRVENAVNSLRDIEFAPVLKLSDGMLQEIRRMKNEVLVRSAQPQSTPSTNSLP